MSVPVDVGSVPVGDWSGLVGERNSATANETCQGGDLLEFPPAHGLELRTRLEPVAPAAQHLNIPVYVLATERQRAHMVHVHTGRWEVVQAPVARGVPLPLTEKTGEPGARRLTRPRGWSVE